MPSTSKVGRTAPLVTILCAVSLLVGLFERPARGQEPSAPQAASPAQLQAAIDKLGDLDYPTRTAASRTVRRTAAIAGRAGVAACGRRARRRLRPVSRAGPADRVQRSPDRRRDARVADQPQRPPAHGGLQLSSSTIPIRAWYPTLLDRSRRSRRSSSGPRWCARSPPSAPTPALQPVLAREAGRGEDFFRSAVIEALGDYKAQYAFDALTAIAKLDGPLQDDAAVALGKIGDKRALETLAALQRSAPQARQPSVAAGICLLGVNCESHESYLVETLKFGDQQSRVSGAAACRGGRPRRAGRRGSHDGRRGAVRGGHSRARSRPAAPSRWRWR